MNGENFSLSEKIVSSSYVRQGSQARRGHEQLIRVLLEQVKSPKHSCATVSYVDFWLLTALHVTCLVRAIVIGGGQPVNMPVVLAYCFSTG